VDRTGLETITKSDKEFLDLLLEKRNKLKRHDFIAKQQAMFLKEIMEELQPGTVVILGDCRKLWFCYPQCRAGLSLDKFASNNTSFCCILQFKY